MVESGGTWWNLVESKVTERWKLVELCGTWWNLQILVESTEWWNLWNI